MPADQEPQSEPADLPPDQVDALVEQFLGSAAPQPVRWDGLSPAEAERTWRKLATWVRWLVARYTLDGRELPPCWYWHGALVEELTALWGSWLVAYDEGQSAAGMADWHRVLHEARHRMREWASRTGCTTHDHRTGDASGWVSGDSSAWLTEFTTAVRADVERRSARATAGP